VIFERLLAAVRKEIRYSGDVVDLVQEQDIPANVFNDNTHSILFGIYKHGSYVKVGTCDLRIGDDPTLYYAGNIGYNVSPVHRGNGYAYHACRVLLPVARDVYGFEKLLITCSPDNEASRRTLEKLNGTLLETVPVPEDHWLYRRGETIKNIYEYDLKQD